jgi:ABC-2 type transport system permease protein
MKDFLWLVRKTLKNAFGQKSSWIIYIGLPLAGVLLSMLLNGNISSGSLKIGIVNQDGDQAITQDAIQFVGSLNQVKLTMTDEASMNDEITSGKLDSGIVLPAGFADSVRQGKPLPVDIVSVKGAQVTAYVKALLDQYLGSIASIGQGTKGDTQAFDQVYAAYNQHGFAFDAETLKDTSNRKDMTYQSVGFLVSFMMFSAVGLTEIILKEKENRTFLRLLSSPISARAYVFSNVAVSLLVLLFQSFMTLVFMKYVFRIDSGIPFGQMYAVLVLFALAAISLALLIVSLAKNSNAAGALQNLIITPTCLLAGCFFPISIMPDTVKKISNFMPQHWLLDTIDKLQNGSSFGSLGLNFGILLAFAAVFAVIAIFRFSRNNDVRQFI